MAENSNEIRITRKRWPVLILFLSNAALCAFQFGNYVVTLDVYVEYFGIEIEQAVRTSQIYMITKVIK
jgi:hypothetical protein